MGKIKELLLEQQEQQMIDTDYFFDKDTKQITVKIEKLPRDWSKNIMNNIIWGDRTCKSSPACEEDVCRCDKYYEEEER